MEGGRIRFRGIWGGAQHATLAGNIEAAAGTVSRIEPYKRISTENNGTITHTGNLTGTGTIRIGGTENYPTIFFLNGDSSGFNGILDVAVGTLALKMGGTYALGDEARIVVNSNAYAALGGLAGTWTARGGIWLEGGRATYRVWSAASGTAWSADTPWHVNGNSSIESYANTGGVDIKGPLHGTANLRIFNTRRTDRDNTAAVNLRGAGSTYSGTIIVQARHQDDNTRDTLLFGSSGALPDTGRNLASLIIEETSDIKGRILIGAWRSDGGGGSTVTSVENVHVKVEALTVGGMSVAKGVYSASNPVPEDGYVFFHNASSSLTVVGPPPPQGTVFWFR